MTRSRYVVGVLAFTMMMSRDIVAAPPVAGARQIADSAVEDSPALTFDSDFLSLGQDDASEEKHVDLSYFAHRGGMSPGRYSVTVSVNGKTVDEGRLVTFSSRPDNPGKLYACVTPDELLHWWGIVASGKDGQPGADALPPAVGTGGRQPVLKKAVSCPTGGVTALVPYAQETFDFNHRLLSLTVPQASLGPASRLRVPAHLWDDGIPALLMNYNYTGSQQLRGAQKAGSDFVGLNGQLNLGGWRLRNDLTAYRQQGGMIEWNLSRGYAQHGFSRFGGGQMTLGYTSSSGGSVDSVSFMGIKVDSDDGMLDPAFTTYTPAITGIAGTPATVTARQYGKVIFQQNVPQGPFSLTDFNRSGSGDVEVEVRETDGSVRHFTLAQASSGVLMRQGARSYSLSAGKATESRGYVDDRFIQGGGSYGTGANTTVTTGMLLSRDYQALAVGGGFYAGRWGAFTYTLNGSRASLAAVPGRNGVARGLSQDLNWSRSFGDTAVGVAYRRSLTENAYGYSTLLGLSAGTQDEAPGRRQGEHDSLALSLSRSLGNWGSIVLNGSRTTSWGGSRKQQNVVLGYNTTIKDVGVSLSAGVSKMAESYRSAGHGFSDEPVYNAASDRKTQRTLALNISLPLGKWLGPGRGHYSWSRSGGSVSQQAGFSGSAMSNRLAYSLSQSLQGNRGGNLSLGYEGQSASFSGGYSYGGNDTLSYGMNGGLALHSQGGTLGKSLALGGGNALVVIPGAPGVRVGDATTDWHGLALIGGMTPYDRNSVSVDMLNLPEDMELDTSSKNVVPTRGALVRVPFRGKTGYRLLLTLQHRGRPVLFGSAVTLKQSTPGGYPISGIVGEDGQAYLSGMPAGGTVVVNWGDAPDEQCTADYTVPAKADKGHPLEVAAVCN